MRRRKALQILGDRSMGWEYAEEAEHQDGKHYWRQFKSAKALIDDFELYRKIAEEEGS